MQLSESYGGYNVSWEKMRRGAGDLRCVKGGLRLLTALGRDSNKLLTGHLIREGLDISFHSVPVCCDIEPSRQICVWDVCGTTTRILHSIILSWETETNISEIIRVP